MSRILLTTIGSLGDLHPFIALALELRHRGHEIVFATTKQFRDRIESLGFAFHAIRPDHINIDDPQTMARAMDLQKGTEWVIKDYFMGSLRDTYADLMDIAPTADFMVAHEIIYAAPLIAEVLKLRWATCLLSPGSFFSVYDPVVMAPLPALAKLRRFGPGVNGWIKNFAKFSTRTWGDSVDQMRQELGLAPVGNPVIDDKFSPYLVLALFSTLVGSPQSDWPPNTVLTGFLFFDGDRELPIQPELQQFLAQGEPPIVFTLGSSAVLTAGDFYESSVGAAKALNRRAVLLIGNNPPPADLPETIIAVDYVPYSKIFPLACAIVHQGGIGTTAQALRAGRPTVVVPYSHDQPDNAARVERLGTSRTISRKRYSSVTAAKELRRLLNNRDYAVRAEKVGQVIHAENSVTVACNAIEQQLQSPAIFS